MATSLLGSKPTAGTQTIAKRFRIRSMAQVQRIYEVEAVDEDEALEMVQQDIGMVSEEDTNEDIDAVEEIV